MGEDRADTLIRATERTAATGTARVSLETVTDARSIMRGAEMEPPPAPSRDFAAS